MGVIRFIGQAFLSVILVVVFYGIFTPIGMLVRLFRDPLDRTLPDDRESFWVRKTPVAFDPKEYEKQR